VSASLPARPSLTWLRKTAKHRLRQLRATQPAARLADTQLAIAREYGFPSWRQLKAHVDQLTAAAAASAAASAIVSAPDSVVTDFLRHVGTGRIDDVHAMLDAAPSLVHAIGPHPFWGGRPQALHVAIEAKRRDMFQLLIGRGADVNGSNDEYDHWSPLMLAIDRNQPQMQEELLTRGARVGLLEALMLADDSRVEALLRSGTLPEITPNGGSILAFARTSFAIDRLIALHAPTEVRDRWGATPIDAMSRLGPRGHALVEQMTRHGVAAEPKEYARLGDVTTLARLVDADPSIARRDDVMMAAVDFRHHALVTWLIERGGNVNARSEVGSRGTALHSAAWNGDLQMVILLVDAGANRDARDEQYHATPEGWASTAIEVSNNQNCAEVVAYLAARRAQ
jgi:ankyrin repeat protein